MRNPLRHVYYSSTEDNPFLPPSYVDDLRRDLDPKMALRMLKGKWLSIAQDVVYHQYDKAVHFKDVEYKVDLDFPIWACWDFNIGEGKPLSMCFFQFINDFFHVFGEVIVEGARTQDALDDGDGRGFYDYKTKFFIAGDATGKSRDTRSIRSDYEIIDKFCANRPGFVFERKVPPANPPIRTRHNLVNAYCRNDHGDIRLAVYRGCKVVDEGMRLTKLKKGGDYVEDDSRYYQHVTTALGYGMVAAVKAKAGHGKITMSPR